MPLSQAGALSDMVEKARTATLQFQRTETKSRIRELRETLSQEDQTLLILRVDKNLAWREIAIIMSGEDDDDAAQLKREAARLRKRFELAKGKLRKLAEAEGLIKPKAQA